LSEQGKLNLKNIIISSDKTFYKELTKSFVIKCARSFQLKTVQNMLQVTNFEGFMAFHVILVQTVIQ